MFCIIFSSNALFKKKSSQSMHRRVAKLRQACAGVQSGQRFCCLQTQIMQHSHRLEKYLNLEGSLEKSLKIKSALKSNGKSLKSLEKSLQAP